MCSSFKPCRDDSGAGPCWLWFDSGSACPDQYPNPAGRTFFLGLCSWAFLAHSRGGIAVGEIQSESQCHRHIWPSSTWVLPNTRGSRDVSPAPRRCEQICGAFASASPLQLLHQVCTSWSCCQTAGVSGGNWHPESSFARCWGCTAPGRFGRVFVCESACLRGSSAPLGC